MDDKKVMCCWARCRRPALSGEKYCRHHRMFSLGFQARVHPQFQEKDKHMGTYEAELEQLARMLTGWTGRSRGITDSEQDLPDE